MKNKRDFPKEPMGKMPQKIEDIFCRKGILTSAVRLVYKSDMGEDLEFCDTWVVLTDSEMAVLEVLGGIFPRKTHSLFDMKKTQVDIVERSFRVYPLEDYEDFHAEELLCENSYDEGDHSDSDAEQCHFKESRLEALALGNRDVVGKSGDYEDDSAYHRKERCEEHRVREQKIG